MLTILAHRANLNGKQSVVENSLAACADALAQGFGLETDLRRDAAGAFYISHDRLPPRLKIVSKFTPNCFKPIRRRNWPSM